MLFDWQGAPGPPGGIGAMGGNGEKVGISWINLFKNSSNYDECVKMLQCNQGKTELVSLHHFASGWERRGR